MEDHATSKPYKCVSKANPIIVHIYVCLKQTQLHMH